MNNKKTQVYSEIDQLIDRESFVQSLEKGFEELEDPRVADNQSYPFIALLVIIICAVIAGANTISDIHIYSETKESLFRLLFGLEKAPSYNVFWWILTRMNPEQFEGCLVRWIQSLPMEDRERLIAIDGKQLRGASRAGKLYLVSAWNSSTSLLLGQVRTQEKSNEIVAIPELIHGLDIHGATITIDAIGCQKNIVEEIRRGGGNYLIALKGNQATLRDEAENFFTQAREVHYEGASCKKIIQHGKGHGRLEERELVVTNQLDWLESRLLWKDLRSMVELTSRRTIQGEKSEATRFFISNLDLTPEQAARLVRSHWSIENHLHWNMDVNFCEDASLASVGHAAENLGTVKRLAGTLIRIDLGGVKGTAKRRKQAAWDDTWMLRLLSKIFEVKL
jgi:predicted transposase YbfD/YdcC